MKISIPRVLILENKILNKVLLEDKAKSMTYSDHLNVEKDYDEGVFKDLLNTKAMLAKRISIHQKHKRQHEEIKKQLAHNSPSERKKLMTEKIQHNIGKFTPYILLIALSFHGIFEGIAIGIQSDLTGLTNLLIAVALHKWAEALTLVKT